MVLIATFLLIARFPRVVLGSNSGTGPALQHVPFTKSSAIVEVSIIRHKMKTVGQLCGFLGCKLANHVQELSLPLSSLLLLPPLISSSALPLKALE